MLTRIRGRISIKKVSKLHNISCHSLFSHIFCTHSLCITDNNHLSLNKMPTTSHVIGLGKSLISDIWNIWTTASVLNSATQSISKLSLTTHDSHLNLSLHSLKEMPLMLLEHWHPLIQLIHPTLAAVTKGSLRLKERSRRPLQSSEEKERSRQQSNTTYNIHIKQ